MGLTKSFTIGPSTYSEGYAKITDINYTIELHPTIVEEVVEYNEASKIMFTVSVYANQAARSNRENPVAIYSYDFVPDWSTETNTLVTQCYEHAKTQPQFIGAIDA